jgi:hypothetical protein
MSDGTKTAPPDWWHSERPRKAKTDGVVRVEAAIEASESLIEAIRDLRENEPLGVDARAREAWDRAWASHERLLEIHRDTRGRGGRRGTIRRPRFCVDCRYSSGRCRCREMRKRPPETRFTLAVRLTRLAQRLRSGWFDVSELAEHNEASIRTTYRDLRRLERLGIPIAEELREHRVVFHVTKEIDLSIADVFRQPVRPENEE